MCISVGVETWCSENMNTIFLHISQKKINHFVSIYISGNIAGKTNSVYRYFEIIMLLVVQVLWLN